MTKKKKKRRKQLRKQEGKLLKESPKKTLPRGQKTIRIIRKGKVIRKPRKMRND
jgi:hypothetical protein